MPSDNPIGQPFIQLPAVESTNNYAMAQVQSQMAEHGFAVFADHQTSGKGQRGKVWEMEHGQNIILSIVIEPSILQPIEQFKLSAVIATGCFDFFSAYALDETKIKWPNDIYWKDRKAGGILIENIMQGNEWKYAIAGMGININQTTFPSHLPNPVSLKQITGKEFDAVSMAKELCGYLNHRWRQLQEGNFDEILKDYNNALYKLGLPVNFKKDGRQIQAVVTGVNEKGELVIDGGRENIAFGEVEWILA